MTKPKQQKAKPMKADTETYLMHRVNALWDHEITEQSEVERGNKFAKMIALGLADSLDPLDPARLAIEIGIGCVLPTTFRFFPVIIYGPKECGKTRNATRFANLFAKPRIIDNFDPGKLDPLDPWAGGLNSSTLALVTANTGPRFAIKFSEAMALLEILQPLHKGEFVKPGKFTPTIWEKIKEIIT